MEAAGGGAELEALADDSLVAALAYLPTNSVLAVCVASSRFVLPARADVVWFHAVSRRWRFGAVPTSKEALLPGARDMVTESALAEAALAPIRSQADVFEFFAKRCRQDVDVALLTLQLNEAYMHPEAAAAPAGADELRPGALVRVVNLTSTLQYNGALGVLGERAPCKKEERFGVALPAPSRSISVRAQNLVPVRPPISEEEAQRRVLECGAAAIDALARFAKATEAGGSLGMTARHLLSKATEEWAEQQWRLLLADPGRTDLLEEGGLVVSQWGEPGEASVARVRGLLAELAAAVEARTSAEAPILERVQAVNTVLFDECGFAGDQEDYYYPQNSFLHSVLERRRGIPISLSILWAAVARRVKVPCFLLANMPAHVLIRVTAGGGGAGLQDDIFVDAFNRQVMDYNAFHGFAMQVAHFFDPNFAVQLPATAVYARILRNLQSIYQDAASRRFATTIQRVEGLWRLAGVCSQFIAISRSAEDADHFRHVREQVLHALDQVRASGRGSSPRGTSGA